MKKILILIPSFGIGGTTSSLSSFLTQTSSYGISTDVFSLQHIGGAQECLLNCQIIEENVWLSIHIHKGGKWKKTANYILQNLRRVLKRIGVNIYPFYCKMAGRVMGTMDYDAVISFQEELSWVLSYIPAKKRIAWIRCDYSRFFNAYKRNELPYFNRIDLVVCVSEFAKKSFLEYYPTLIDKTIVINNFLDEDDIFNKSKESLPEGYLPLEKRFTILSLGRIDRVKQFELVPSIAGKIKSARPNFIFLWLIVGSGDKNLEQEIKQEIKAKQLEDNVYLRPATSNVFPIIANTDLFVHTSKSETFSRVVNEAKALNVPVLINNYGCANEFVEDGREGWIVPVADMWEKIIDICDNPQILTTIRTNLEQTHYDNQRILKQIRDLV